MNDKHVSVQTRVVTGADAIYARRLAEREAMNRYSDSSQNYESCNHQYTKTSESTAELSEQVYNRYALNDWSEGKSPTVIASETYYLTFTTPEKGVYRYESISSGKITATGQGTFQVEKSE